MAKKKLIYVGHPYHNRTKSTHFLRDILRTKYDFYEVAFDGDSQQWVGAPSLFEKDYDILVLFQMPIPIDVLREKLHFEKCVFFPMFDACGEAPLSFWENYKQFIIINFSSTLHKRLASAGMTSYYVQYYPKPAEDPDPGACDSAFFWQRTDITINTVASMLLALGIKKLHLHIAPDPHFQQEPPAPEYVDKFTLSETRWFESKDDMLKEVMKSAVYVAPRSYEGIGMSFLEAMAMGRCILATDHPTMNEYIRNGENGLLYPAGSTHFWTDTEYSPEMIRAIQQAAYRSIQVGYAAWEKNKYLILDWVEEPLHFHPLRFQAALAQEQLAGIMKGFKPRFTPKSPDGQWYLFGIFKVPRKLVHIAKRLLKCGSQNS